MPFIKNRKLVLFIIRLLQQISGNSAISRVVCFHTYGYPRPVFVFLLTFLNDMVSSAPVWIFVITPLGLAVAGSDICYSVKHGNSIDCDYGCCGGDGDKTCCNLLGVIVGAVVGSLLAVGAVVGVIICCLKSQKIKGRTIRPSGEADLQRATLGPTSVCPPPPPYSFTEYSPHYVHDVPQVREITGKTPPPAYNDPAYPPVYYPPGQQTPYTAQPLGHSILQQQQQQQQQHHAPHNNNNNNNNGSSHTHGHNPLHESPPPYCSPINTISDQSGLNPLVENLYTQSDTNNALPAASTTVQIPVLSK